MRWAAERQIGTEIYAGPLRSLRIWSAISWIFRSVCCRAASAFEVRSAASRSRQVGLWLVRSARLDRLNQPTIPSLLPHRAAVTCPIPVLGLSMPRRTRDVHRAGDEAVSGSTQAHPDRHPAGELLQSGGRGLAVISQLTPAAPARKQPEIANLITQTDHRPPAQASASGLKVIGSRPAPGASALDGALDLASCCLM